MNRHTKPVAWLYEHDGMVHDEEHPPMLRSERWHECGEPWNETPLYAKPNELIEALKSCLAMLERASCSTGYCCCGSSVERHGFGDGHSPVDEGDYYQMKTIDTGRAALAKFGEEPAGEARKD